MKGIAITMASVFLGSAVAHIDTVSGVILVIVGGLGGIVVMWGELS